MSITMGAYWFPWGDGLNLPIKAITMKCMGADGIFKLGYV